MAVQAVQGAGGIDASGVPQSLMPRPLISCNRLDTCGCKARWFLLLWGTARRGM